MQPLVDEIKRCYKGQERYYYLKTLNRQHGYSPLKAMIPVLSLLLQIPFFIAAYQYLEHFEALKGVSFGFIKDLSQPDGLFGAINFLPIAMTIVNLITAWFYTRNGNTSERKQMLIIALAFLVLLFKLPSGLVLYWTMNNVFSFFRLFVTNPEVFKTNKVKPEKSIKQINYTIVGKIFIPLFILGFLIQLNWACHYNFKDFTLRVFTSSIISIVLSLALSIFIPGKYGNKIKYNFKTQFTRNAFWIVLFFAVISQINWAIIHKHDTLAIRLFTALIVSYVFVFIIDKWYVQVKNNKYLSTTFIREYYINEKNKIIKIK